MKKQDQQNENEQLRQTPVSGSNVASALKVLQKALKTDKGFRASWMATIAMSYKDCEHWYKQKTGKKNLNKYDKHVIANDAAEHFLKLLCAE